MGEFDILIYLRKKNQLKYLDETVWQRCKSLLFGSQVEANRSLQLP